MTRSTIIDLEKESDEHLDDRIRLTRDLMDAARIMGDEEARYIVDAYYMTQENRKRTENQTRALGFVEEPNLLVSWISKRNWTLEQQIMRALDEYTKGHIMGAWMRDLVGIGPVLSAGILAHLYMGQWCLVCKGHNLLDCEERQQKEAKKAKAKQRFGEHQYQQVDSCPTVGHIWQFAGIAGDGQKPWLKGQIRPFNASLKVLCWKIGQSFMKLSSHPNCFYGHVYKDRKAYEVANNEAGKLASKAASQLPHFDKSTESYKWYAQGKLPPAHLDARARRYAVKLFLSHLHGEWHLKAFGRPAPLPYPIAFLGHAHIIPPPARASAAE